MRPDAIVSLPGGRRVIVDAKVSLKAYEAYTGAASDDERQNFLRQHLNSVKSHIRQLSGKAYHELDLTELDFVVMFVPIEGALALALGEDKSLTTLAIEQSVGLATPATLMMALRTIANVWQVERRTTNAEEIARRAGLLYDKFVGFVDDLQALFGRRQERQGPRTLPSVLPGALLA